MSTDVPEMEVHVFVRTETQVFQEKVDSSSWGVLSRKFVVAEFHYDARLPKNILHFLTDLLIFGVF